MTYTRQNLGPDLTELSRRAELNKQIDELYGDLAPDEIEILAQDCAKSTTRALEILRVRSQSSRLMDLCEDIEFKPVRFPPTLLPFLKKHDVFFATLGFKNASWFVIHLSRRYDTDYA